MRYADDTTLLASTQERIRKFFKDMVQESARYNMYINAQKSKIMVVSRQDNISVQVDMKENHWSKCTTLKSMVWAVFQHGVEGWTLKKSDRNRIEAFEMWCWKEEHRTNDSILTELGLERKLMGRVAKLKLQYFGHITRGSAGQLALTVL